MLTMVLGVTPVRENETIFTWRIVVRRLAGRLSWPIDRAFTRLLWTIIRRNVHVDLEVLKWMSPPKRTLWVKPDGSSVRNFREFYARNITEGTPTTVGTKSHINDNINTALKVNVMQE